MELLLTETKNRFVLFPIQYPEIWKWCKRQQALDWKAEEIDLSEDLKDWNKLKPEQKHFISTVLAFFAASDGIVAENLLSRFAEEVKWPEVRYFYGTQNQMEHIHSETYSLLIDTYIDSEVEKTRLFNAIDTIPVIKQKSDWALKWLFGNESFAERLIAFACVEGIFFCSSFCAIYYIQEQGLLPGLCFSNELISRDETMHMSFACHLYREHIQEKISYERLKEIINEAISIEEEYVVEALPVSMIGMNSHSMLDYIKFIADGLVMELGYPPIYGTKQPFQFMEKISLQNKTNFFEARVGQYARANHGESKQTKIVLSEDF